MLSMTSYRDRLEAERMAGDCALGLMRGRRPGPGCKWE